MAEPAQRVKDAAIGAAVTMFAAGRPDLNKYECQCCGTHFYIPVGSPEPITCPYNCEVEDES